MIKTIHICGQYTSFILLVHDKNMSGSFDFAWSFTDHVCLIVSGIEGNSTNSQFLNLTGNLRLLDIILLLQRYSWRFETTSQRRNLDSRFLTITRTDYRIFVFTVTYNNKFLSHINNTLVKFLMCIRENPNNSSRVAILIN